MFCWTILKSIKRPSSIFYEGLGPPIFKHTLLNKVEACPYESRAFLFGLWDTENKGLIASTITLIFLCALHT